jgi:hypothetical protein
LGLFHVEPGVSLGLSCSPYLFYFYARDHFIVSYKKNETIFSSAGADNWFTMFLAFLMLGQKKNRFIVVPQIYFFA